MTKIIYWWDVFFTFIDNWQLRKYVKLKEIRQDLIESKENEMDQFLYNFKEDKELETFWEEDCNPLKLKEKGE
jgi:hypothetical protein